MDFGQLYAGLNALDVAMVKRNPDGTFAGLKEGSETLGIPTVKVNPVTGEIRFSAPVGVRTTTVRIATFGDSTAAVGTIQSPDNQDTTVYTAPFPASGSTILGTAIDKISVSDYYPMAYLVGNGGISGQTSTQMLARDSAGASITRRSVTDIVNLAPDVVIFRGGSINDVMALTAGASTQADIDAIYSRHVQLLDRLLTGGAYVLDEGIYGYSPASGTQADIDYRKSAIVQLNTRYASYAAQTERVRFISSVGLIANADGSYMTGMCESTGVHLNNKSQEIMAREEAAVLASIFGQSTIRSRFPGVNLAANPMLSATGAQGYGTVATGWTAGASGATRQNAKVETLYGMRFQTCEYVISASAQYGTLYAPFDPTALSILANDVFGIEFWVLVQNVSGEGIPAPNNEIINVTVKKSAAGAVVVNPLLATYARSGLDKSTRLFRVAIPLKIQEPTASLIATGSELYLKWGTDTLGTYKLGMSAPRIVKLGQAVTTI